MKKTILMISLLTLFFVTFSSLSGFSRGVGAGSFLRFAVDAKALGMGGAFVALADNYSATYWNPAGIASIVSPQVGGMYTRPYSVQGLNLTFLSGITKLKGFAVAGTYAGFNTTYYSSEGENLSYGERVYSGSLGLDIHRLVSIGGSVKSYHFAAPGGGVQGKTARAQGMGIDLGVQGKLPWSTLSDLLGLSGDKVPLIGELVRTPSLLIGGSVADLGSTNIKWKNTPAEPVNTVPTIYRLGAALSMDTFVASFGVDLAGSESRKAGAARNLWRVGAQFQLSDQLALRVGMVKPEDSKLFWTAGAGFKLTSFTIDLAWLQNKSGLAAGESVGDTYVLSAHYAL